MARTVKRTVYGKTEKTEKFALAEAGIQKR
jgi:hypothetical protein